MSDKKVYLVTNSGKTTAGFKLGIDISDDMELELGKLRPLIRNSYGWGFPLYEGDMVLWDGGLYSDEVGNKSIYGLYGVRCEIGGVFRDIMIGRGNNTITGSLSDYTGEFVPIYKLLEQGSLVDITISISREDRLSSIGI